MEHRNAGKVYVYRAFDAEKQLLYVGITKDLVKRFAKHEDAHWIWDIASLTAEVYESRQEAHAAEVEAIRAELPRWNVMHTADVRGAVAEHRAMALAKHPERSFEERLVHARRLRRMTWPIQYGCTLPPLDEAGEIIGF